MAPANRKPGTKPVVRLLHHMARSGGTLISRCLGSMDGVCLLSEIHPAGATSIRPERFRISPLKQALEWYGLFGEADLKRFRTRPVTFQQLMWMIEQRASGRGLKLVVRDWSHLDWIGLPFARPGFGSPLAQVFEGAYDVRRFCTVRHPIDQWLSLMKLPLVANSGLTIERYLLGMLRFSELCDELGFVRYEDLTHEPDTHLATICEKLELDFDPGYAERWSSYTKITGDTNFSRGGAEAIRPLERRPAPDGLVDAFRAHESYARIKELLGYETD
jgi:protein O-GlcNAc transferase